MRFTISLLALLSIATPAAAITKQQAPAPRSGQRAAIVDPDERLDRLTDRQMKAARKGSYDRSSARSVMDFGTAASTGPR